MDKLLHGMNWTNKLWDTVVETSPNRRGSTDEMFEVEAWSCQDLSEVAFVIVSSRGLPK